MAWNDWKAAMKDGLSSFKWNPKPAAEAAEAYMRSELKRTGQLPTGEPPPKQAMWNPISEERQRALAVAEKASGPVRAAETAKPMSMSAFSRGMLEETGKMDRGRGQQELSLPSAARGRGRGPSL